MAHEQFLQALRQTAVDAERLELSRHPTRGVRGFERLQRADHRTRAGKIRAARNYLGRPFLIENIAYYFKIPGNSMTEAQFILRVLELADCGMLLDVNNVYANCRNHGDDAYRFIEQMPAERVVELHLAGGQMRDDLYIDTHGHPVCAEVWGLLEYAVASKQPKAVILEREQNLTSIQATIAEVRQARAIWRAACADASTLKETDDDAQGID